MSGGSLEYVYQRVADAADMVETKATTDLHREFAAHLELVAKALKALEWMLSDDTSPGDEVAAIEAVLPRSKDAEIEALNAEIGRWRVKYDQRHLDHRVVLAHVNAKIKGLEARLERAEDDRDSIAIVLGRYVAGQETAKVRLDGLRELTRLTEELGGYDAERGVKADDKPTPR